MVYKFVILSDEVDDYRREIEIDGEATFMELNNLLINTNAWKNDQMNSFFLSNEDWEKGQEITMVDMSDDPTQDSAPIMDRTHLDDLINEEGANLLFEFDQMCDRYLYMHLKSIEQKAHLLEPKVTLTKGMAPQQTKDIDAFIRSLEQESRNMYGDDEFDPDELDAEGFQDLEEMEGGDF